MPDAVRSRLESIPGATGSEIQEIRLRNGLPLAVTVRGKTLYVLKDGQTSYSPKDAYVCSKDDIEKAFALITDKSVYSRLGEIKQGYIKMPFGCRAGICGTFSDEGMISDISGINIRLAKEYIGCADTVFSQYSGGAVLILGPPGSGKTTVLRDLIRLVSNSGRRVAVVDSRGELSASSSGRPFYDLGSNTDTYMTKDKAFGVVAALRTMFPQVIAFDEIGKSSEVEGVAEAFNAGVDILTTAHIGTAEDIRSRKVLRELMAVGTRWNVFLLSGTVGQAPVRIEKEELLYASS